MPRVGADKPRRAAARAYNIVTAEYFRPFADRMTPAAIIPMHVRPNGTPIPRLYSAGELGSIYSYLYQGTGNIGECLAFGRVSGRNAAAETPWS